MDGEIDGWTDADEALERAGEWLDRAAQRLSGAEEIYADRLAFVRAGYEYTRRMTESRRLMERVEGDDDAEAAERIRANTRRIQEIQEQFSHAFLGYVEPGKHRVSDYHLED